MAPPSQRREGTASARPIPGLPPPPLAHSPAAWAGPRAPRAVHADVPLAPPAPGRAGRVVAELAPRVHIRPPANVSRKSRPLARRNGIRVQEGGETPRPGDGTVGRFLPGGRGARGLLSPDG